MRKRDAWVASMGGYEKVDAFSSKDWKGYGNMFTLWDVFTPSFTCPFELERIGRVADGGKVSPDEFSRYHLGVR